MGEINDKDEREKIEYSLKIKNGIHICIRHSTITADSDYLPEYTLKKKVRWSMNSRQGSKYIKRRMGDELKSFLFNEYWLKQFGMKNKYLLYYYGQY